jgi:hypothetical protein
MEMNNEEIKKYGNLFGSVDLLTKEHLDMILQSMNTDQALFFLVEAIKLAYKNNVYTIGEVEVISKSIRVLTDQPNIKE